jgi:tripartite-type tricarboxylate transporter receptor subunit TctC
VKDFTAASYIGILAPAKTPPEIIAALEGALKKALADKTVQDKFLAVGADLVPPELQTSKGFGDYIKNEYAASAQAAKIANLKPE